jgi:hypothetical protein
MTKILFARASKSGTHHSLGCRDPIQKVIPQSFLAMDNPKAEKPEPKKADPMISPVFGKKKDWQSTFVR